jgi:endonuclease YncB( thermonuclease family)
MITRPISWSIVVLALAWAPVMHAMAQVETDASGLIDATVTRTIDGDSLDARVSNNRTAVGYLGAEAPPANQPCGQIALARNRELAGTQVMLAEDSAYELDDRGRRLYYAFTPDGRSIDAILIGEGLARAVRTDASRGPELAALQAEAESTGRGCLWGGA